MPVVGDVVQFVFWDHAENDDAMLFEVYGVVTANNKTAYTVHTWRHHDPLRQAADDNKDNENYFSIVKKTIVSHKVYT